jgi:hypothetical protein
MRKTEDRAGIQIGCHAVQFAAIINIVSRHRRQSIEIPAPLWERMTYALVYPCVNRPKSSYPRFGCSWPVAASGETEKRSSVFSPIWTNPIAR